VLLLKRARIFSVVEKLKMKTFSSWFIMFEVTKHFRFNSFEKERSTQNRKYQEVRVRFS
jgi:hypothetical protein